MKRFLRALKNYILNCKKNRYALDRMEACLKLSNIYYTRYLHDAYMYGLQINPSDGMISKYYWNKYKLWCGVHRELTKEKVFWVKRG